MHSSDSKSGSESALRFQVPALLLFSLAVVACDDNDSRDDGRDRPAQTVPPTVHATGNAALGQQVFRFELFGNEKFFADALRLQQGIVAAGVTPVQALQLGLSVDVDALDPATRAVVAAELLTDLSPTNAPTLNNPATTVALINANAVIGVVPKDSNNDGSIDVLNGDKVGASCALCHGITDGSVFSLPGGGSIGKRIDGPAVHNLDFGKLIAAAQNSRALYPLLQLSLTANGGATLGRAPNGLTETSTEAEVDAYLSNPAFYPVGMFDDSFDGNGDPMKNPPFFRSELAAPWGSEGSIARLDNFSNLVYTGLLDPTRLLSPEGRAFLRKLGGPAGDEIASDYAIVLQATSVTGFPFVDAAQHPNPGTEDAPLGVRVDEAKLLDLNAYVNSLQAPDGDRSDPAAIAEGRALFRNDCTGCHDVDSSRPVSAVVFPMAAVFPGDNPVTLLAAREPPLNPILDTPGVTFDDKMAVVNASIRGEPRGVALPLLLDLARKPNFLHDSSVPSLDNLLDPARGENAPHPFFVGSGAQRARVIAFLRSLDTR